MHFRPNNDSEAKGGCWGNCGWIWCFNWADLTDRVKSATTAAWSRRIRAFGLFSSFTNDDDSVDSANQVFLADENIRGFLCTREAGAVFWRHILIPYARRLPPSEHRQRITVPRCDVVRATTKMLAKMARIDEKDAPVMLQEGARLIGVPSGVTGVVNEQPRCAADVLFDLHLALVATIGQGGMVKNSDIPNLKRAEIPPGCPSTQFKLVRWVCENEAESPALFCLNQDGSGRDGRRKRRRLEPGRGAYFNSAKWKDCVRRARGGDSFPFSAHLEIGRA